MSLPENFDPHLVKHGPKIGVNSISSLLFYLPKKYIDFSNIDSDFEGVYKEGRRGLFKLRVLRVNTNSRSRPKRVTAVLSDGNQEVLASKFGAIFGWFGIKSGSIVFISSKVDKYEGKWSLKDADIIHDYRVGSIYPEYKGVKGTLSHECIAAGVKQALRDHADVGSAFIQDYLEMNEADIISKVIPEFSSIEELLNELHSPSSMQSCEIASSCAARMNVFAVMKSASRVGKKTFCESSMVTVDYSDVKDAVSRLPFTPTLDQKRCMFDIFQDLRSPYTMDRVIVGDVGCGKTLAYGLPAVMAHLTGARVVIMVPNLMLAHQIHEELSTMAPGVKTALVVEGHSHKAIDNELVIGTTAICGLLKKQKEYQADLVIIDEQQKFSQKQKLSIISTKTNLVQASATPIPKTMGEIIFGGKAVSYMEESPVEKTIHSYVVTAEDKAWVMKKLSEIVKSGHQISALYPLRASNRRFFEARIRSESDFQAIKKEIQGLKGKRVSKPRGDCDEGFHVTFTVGDEVSEDAIKSFSGIDGVLGVEEIQDPEMNGVHQKTVEDASVTWGKVFPGRVVSVHGGMETERKVRAISEAKMGSCDAIISSSIIEIGLTFPRLMGMLVVDAERYGASTLHQIRGRLARKGGVGYFFMLVDKPASEVSQDSLDRLNILVKSGKGSEVAYQDMLQRGFGEIAREEGLQSGHVHSIFPSIKIKPEDILSLTQKKAFKT